MLNFIFVNHMVHMSIILTKIIILLCNLINIILTTLLTSCWHIADTYITPSATENNARVIILQNLIFSLFDINLTITDYVGQYPLLIQN